MPVLYNCRHSGDQYRITKFDDDMNPQGSYLLSLEECDCPAGVRPTCRHRQMLPKFIARQHVGDEWLFDFDRGGWVQMGDEWAQQDLYGTSPAITALPDLPEGVHMIVLDSPDKVVDVHNAIADTVGETEFLVSLSQTEKHTIIYTTDEPPLEITHVELFVDVPQEPPSPSHIKRRF